MELWHATLPKRSSASSYRAQAFYLRPQVTATVSVTPKGCALTLTVHDAFYRTYGAQGNVTLWSAASPREIYHSSILVGQGIHLFWRAVYILPQKNRLYINHLPIALALRWDSFSCHSIFAHIGSRPSYTYQHKRHFLPCSHGLSRCGLTESLIPQP